MSAPSKRPSDSISLYVHIPFCETRCPYCDFNTYAGIEDLIPQYTDALAREIALWGEVLGHPRLSTIFLGGGTPSYLPARHIAAILEAAHSVFQLDAAAEITMESNPGDFSGESLRAYLELGINRLSIGFQSLRDGLLQVLGRRHSAEEATHAYKLAREAGFANVNIDLMYGVPYQDMAAWSDALTQVLSLSPDHLSLYCLTLEEGIPLESRVRSGEIPQPDPDLAADMYILAEEVLDAAAFHHYEISNWARPGYESRHNLAYWRNLPYLGVGPGAHSYLFGYRFFNIKSPGEYIKRLTTGDIEPASLSSDTAVEIIQAMRAVQDVEGIGPEMEMAETLMMGLRLGEGISLQGFRGRFDTELEDVWGQEVEDLTSLGLVVMEDGALRLTPRGRLLGNEVFQRFVAQDA